MRYLKLSPCLFGVFALLVVLLLISTPASAKTNVIPGGAKILSLVRTSILTLNDAIQTGNFTVMRDRGSPAFRSANSAARLSAIFTGLLKQKLDLSSVSTMIPKLTQTPKLDRYNHLHIKGHFLSRPIRLDFNLIYQSVGGSWRIFGISVNPVRVKARGKPARTTKRKKKK